MTEQLNTKDYLKMRHFIKWDQMDAQEKIKSLQEKSKQPFWCQKLIRLRRWFKLPKEQ